MNQNKKNNNLLIPFIIVLVLLVAAVAYISVDKFILPKDECETSSGGEVEEEPKAEQQKAGEVKCMGTYEGEYNGLAYIYNLNDNGTFSASYGDDAGTIGAFVITDNTVSFIGRKETHGDESEDPIYSTKDYVMAEDCSYIVANDGTATFRLNKES